jgi:hypothetical protein
MDEIQLNSPVALVISEETGVVIGVAHYAENATQYQVHYLDAHAAAKTEWFTRSQLRLV